MSMEKMSTDVIVGPDDSTMRKLRVNVSNICTSAYTQGLAARTSKEIKLTHEQVRPAIRGQIAARMPKDIPEELTDRMTNTLTDAFMGVYAHSPDADQLSNIDCIFHAGSRAGWLPYYLS